MACSGMVGLFRLAGQQLWVLKPLAIGGLPPFYLLIDYLFNHLKPHQVCPAAQPRLPLIRAITRRKSPPTISETACLKTLDVASRAAHGASSVHQTNMVTEPPPSHEPGKDVRICLQTWQPIMWTPRRAGDRGFLRLRTGAEPASLYWRH